MRKERGRPARLRLGNHISNHEDRPGRGGRGRSERERKESALEPAESDMPEGHPDGAEVQMGVQKEVKTQRVMSSIFSV